jgi:hypothetical protein
MTLCSNSPPLMSDIENAETESGVRRALGLDGVAPGSDRGTQVHRPHTPDHQKRRFAREGEVPVVILHGRTEHGRRSAKDDGSIGPLPRNRLEIAEATLREEREARARAERSLIEAQAMIHDLHTKLGHAALARDEAREAAEQAVSERQKTDALLTAEREAREKAETDLQQALAHDIAKPELRDMNTAISRTAATEKIPPTVIGRSVPMPVQSKVTKAAPRPRSADPEPKPIKWWIKPKPVKR